MRKSLTILGLTLAMAGIVQAQDFNNPPTLENRNASGFPYYMLEWPDNVGAIRVDTYDDDWAWFDPEYVLTMDEWKDEGDRPAPSRDDLDVTTKMAWKDQYWYVFMSIHDDTLSHEGTAVRRWDGDMLGFILDPQDHGRTRGKLGFSQEYVAAPGDLTDATYGFTERYPESEGGDGPATWRMYGESPFLIGGIRVDPAEAWAADSWTSDTGGDTYYEWRLAVWDQFQDDPSTSTPRDLNAQAGENGKGLSFVFFVEDGDPGFENDWTVRGSEATARQYFALAKLLKKGEFSEATAVEETTWGHIKSTF